MTFLVSGQVTGFEYEDLPGVDITVTNKRTGQSQTVDPDGTGLYSVDLDGASFPTAKATGDEITIACTHRGITRSWTAYVAGTGISQDVYFTHGTWEGVLRRAKLILVDTLTGKTTSPVTLRDALTEEVLQVKKNGTVLATSGWSFAKPSSLTLTVAPIASDVFEVKRAVLRGKAAAKEAVVEEGDAEVRNAVTRSHKQLMGKRIPELQAISEALAAARLRDELYSGGAKVDEEAKSLRATAGKRLDEIRRGVRDLTDQDDGYVAPSVQTETGPRSSETRTHTFTRWSETRRDVI